MTTFRGAMRSYTAAMNRANRIQQQRNRETAKRYKMQQKIEQLQSAAEAVAEWKSYVTTLTSIHKEHSEHIDWNEVATTPQPVAPIKGVVNEKIAKLQLDSFRPSFIDKIFGFTNKKVERLTLCVEKAKEADMSEHNFKLGLYNKELENWNKLQTFAKGIENKDTLIYKEIMEFFNPFDEIANLGKQLKFLLNENYIDIELDTCSEGIIPDFELNLTSTGKLSRKDMNNSKFNELYLEHLCSCLIRVAKEVTCYFPVNYITISSVSKDLNKATGHVQNEIILSALTTPSEISKLNLQSLTPSETIKSFLHNIKFTKANGFSPVEKLDVKKTILSS